MAHKTGKDMGFRIDSSTGVLVDLSGDVNSQSIQRAVNLLEDTGMGEEESTFLPGLANTKVAINGMVNTTTDAIFGPLVADNTSRTKTVEFKSYASRFYNGEVWVQSYEKSGDPGSLETFSADLQFTGAVNRTSVAL
jgi:hypothetical protein